MRKKGILTLALILLLSVALIGCSSTKPAATSGSATTGAAGQPEFTWRFQVVHNPEQLEYKIFDEICQDINNASNGRMKIDLYPGGSFASSMEAFQACGEGVFEMHSSWPSYLKGIEYAFGPLSEGNMSVGPLDRMIYLEQGGGNELLQKGFDKVNLQYIAYHIWPPDTLAASQDFKSISEMKGKKFRTSAPDVAIKEGMTAITLPLEEVFTSMATGNVDLAEFGYLAYNKGLGITDVAPYGLYPDFWNCSFVETIVVNKDAWNKLPDDLKNIIKMAFQAKAVKHYAMSEVESAKTLKELSESGKVTFRRLPQEDFVRMRKEMLEIEQAKAQKYGGLTKEAYDSLYNFYKLWYPYKTLTAHWSDGMTADEMAGFDIPQYHKE